MSKTVAFIPPHKDCGGGVFRCSLCGRYVWEDRCLHTKVAK